MELLEREGNPIISPLNAIVEMETIYAKAQVIIQMSNNLKYNNIFTIVTIE